MYRIINLYASISVITSIFIRIEKYEYSNRKEVLVIPSDIEIICVKNIAIYPRCPIYGRIPTEFLHDSNLLCPGGRYSKL